MRIACLNTHVPHRRIPYSSGQFTLAWLSALSTEADIELLVPATPQNLSAPTELPSNVEVTLIPVSRERSLLDRCHYNAYGGVTPGLSVLSGFRASDRFSSAVEAADVVEIHQHHLLPLVSDVRRRSGRTPVTGIVMDVMSQKMLRDAQLAKGIRRKLGSTVRTRRAARMEARLINRLDHVLTFSHKDVALLENLGVSTPIEVIEPLVRMPEARARPPKEPVVTFTGALFQIGELRIDQVVSRRSVANRREAGPRGEACHRRCRSSRVAGRAPQRNYRRNRIRGGLGCRVPRLVPLRRTPTSWRWRQVQGSRRHGLRAARDSDSHSGRRNSRRRGRELLRGDNRRSCSNGRENRVLPTAPGGRLRRRCSSSEVGARTVRLRAIGAAGARFVHQTRRTRTARRGSRRVTEIRAVTRHGWGFAGALRGSGAALLQRVHGAKSSWCRRSFSGQ